MSIQEKKNIVSIISALVISGIYFWYVFSGEPLADMNTDEQLKFWATTLLVLIPVKIVGIIIIHIIFAIGNSIATHEKEPPKDERDKLIELKASRNSEYIFGMGFILAMIALAMGKSVTTMFILIVGCGLLSEVLSHVWQLYFYRKGISHA